MFGPQLLKLNYELGLERGFRKIKETLLFECFSAKLFDDVSRPGCYMKCMLIEHGCLCVDNENL